MTAQALEDNASTFEIHTDGDADLREELAAKVVRNGWSLRMIDLRRSSLEDRFVRAVSEADVGEFEAA